MRSIHAVAAAIALLAAGAHAAPIPAAPAAADFRVGNLRLVAVRDATNRVLNDGKTFGLDVGPDAVTRLLTSVGAPTDHVDLNVGGLVVNVPGHVVLIDSGLGPGANGNLIASLATAGITPAQVTDVLITHSHGDHVGGLVGADGKPAFPGAVVRMSAKEWAFLQAKPAMAALVTAITPLVKTFQPGTEFLPGITAVSLPGHTPGHVGYEIVSRGERLLDIGDTAHSSLVSLAHPEWTIGFDTDKVQGVANRRATLASLAASHERIFAPHFPFPGVGRIVKSGDGYAWAPDLAAVIPAGTR